jgi:hypothetical protein
MAMRLSALRAVRPPFTPRKDSYDPRVIVRVTWIKGEVSFFSEISHFQALKNKYEEDNYNSIYENA